MKNLAQNPSFPLIYYCYRYYCFYGEMIPILMVLNYILINNLSNIIKRVK